MRLITANVNGIRAALRRGGVAWLAAQEPDVLALQEVRADDDTLRHILANTGFADWHVAHAVSEQKGRAGVAIASREEPQELQIGWGPDDEFNQSGRWVEVDLTLPSIGELTVASCYVHTGEADTPKQDEKLRFLTAMSDRMAELTAAQRPAVIAGDLNVAHAEVDIKNWKGNLKKAGFLPEERAFLDEWLANGWVDLGRARGGAGPGPYTWWSWRGKAFDNDAGWRIDYLLVTEALAANAVGVSVGRADSYAERWSDHAAVTADFSS